jgi:hypothetical protein
LLPQTVTVRFVASNAANAALVEKTVSTPESAGGMHEKPSVAETSHQHPPSLLFPQTETLFCGVKTAAKAVDVENTSVTLVKFAETFPPFAASPQAASRLSLPYTTANALPVAKMRFAFFTT